MKRKADESYEDYAERRKQDNIKTKLLKLAGAFVPIKSKVHKKTGRITPVCKAIGKKHKGESLADFNLRRKASNARRRERERGYYV